MCQAFLAVHVLHNPAQQPQLEVALSQTQIYFTLFCPLKATALPRKTTMHFKISSTFWFRLL
jgi:hypothetical protein